MPRYKRSVPSSIRVNLLDHVFGQLTVIGFGGRRNGQTMWIARCECGNIAEYHAGNLRAGRSSKCVHCQLEILQQSKKNFSHGYSSTSTYRAWTGTRRYGRCRRWERFENFLTDMGERPDGARLVRVNRRKPYGKSNAVWRSPAETLKEDIDRTLEAMISAGVIPSEQRTRQRKRLLRMTRQARYQLRTSLRRNAAG
ncbi:MAG: hypothetical protein ACYC6Y_08065 [Thermoguttaceae bacterium]